MDLCMQCATGWLRVKLGIVNMSRQLSGGPSLAHDAFIYRADSASNLHAVCVMRPCAAAVAVVAIATAYPKLC